MSTPLITVAMPVFNAGKFLKPALLSIINQTYSNWELIIIDDGCTDGCFNDLPELNDPRIKLIRDGENKGIARRLNEAINLAGGEFLARMDSDDISHPQRFELQLNQLLSQPKLDLLATKVLTIDKNNEVIGALPFKQNHLEICAKPWLGFYMAHPSWMGKLSWFKKHFYADPAPYLCEDQELLLRTYTVSMFSTLNQELLMYRINNNPAIRKLLITRFAFFKVQIKYFLDNNNYIFLIFAFSSFVLRIVKDCMQILVSSYKNC